MERKGWWSGFEGVELRVGVRVRLRLRLVLSLDTVL